MAAIPRDERYVNDVRAAVRNIWESALFLKSQQVEWNAQNYGTTLILSETGDNSDVDRDKVGAAVFAAADALDAVIGGTLDPQNLPGAIAGNLTDLL